MKSDKDKLIADFWRTLPVTLSYQITIWSDRRSEVDDIYRELMMYLVTDNPHITLKLDGMEVPEVLLSGDHKKIKEYREQESLKRTLERRPDLLNK